MNNSFEDVAIYLADCHAATAFGVLEKNSSPKYERLRQRSILTRAAECLKAGALVGARPSKREDVLARIERTLLRFPE
jgi:hypothetical protein